MSLRQCNIWTKVSRRASQFCTLANIARNFFKNDYKSAVILEGDQTNHHDKLGLLNLAAELGIRDCKVMEVGKASVMCVTRRTVDGNRRNLNHYETNGSQMLPGLPMRNGIGLDLPPGQVSLLLISVFVTIPIVIQPQIERHTK